MKFLGMDMMRKLKRFSKLFLFALTMIVNNNLLFAQDDAKANEILDKAMGSMINEEGNLAIYFEGVSYGLANPVTIFSQPAYKVYRGGYFINAGKKFEIQVGKMKALSDGKLMVFIDEAEKMMYVDSVNSQLPDEESILGLDKMINEHFKDGVYKYQGIEALNGKQCHKIKAEFPEDPSKHVYYWVEKDANKLLLIGEWQDNQYDAYWVKKITKAPDNHNYSINLPPKRIETYYGYEVVDLRFNKIKN